MGQNYVTTSADEIRRWPLPLINSNERRIPGPAVETMDVAQTRMRSDAGESHDIRRANDAA
jgi:hypothetical protein